MRQANVLMLMWTKVDLARRVVWVEAADAKARRAIGVPLSDRALEILQALRGIDNDFVFTYRGRPVQEIKTAWLAACVRAGLGRFEGGREVPAHHKNGKYVPRRVTGAKYVGFTWHGLRHTWATWHVQNGTPLEVLKDLGGWSDLRMVMVYAHDSPGYLAQFANNTKKRVPPVQP